MLSGSIGLTTNFRQTPADLAGSLPFATQLPLAWTITTGTGADQADNKYSYKGTIAASTPMVIDLTALLDYRGQAITCARIKSILIVNRAVTPTWVLLLGYAATTTNAHVGFLSNPGQVTIRPSSAASPAEFLMTAPDATGYPVSGSSKLLQLDPGTHPIPVEVEITTSSA